MKPLISVIMSVYNGEKYLKESVDSILIQSYDNFEFIIINDGSTDQTQTILENYTDSRIILVSRENRGLISSLNQGIEISSGKYIARHDSDDISLINRFAKQVNYLEKHPDYVIVGSSSIVIDNNGKVIRYAKAPSKDTDIRWYTFFYSAFHHPTIMVRTDVLKENHLSYDPVDLHAEDMGLWPKLLDTGKAFNFSKPLIKHRIHSNQISNIFNETQKSNSVLILQRNFNKHNFIISTKEIVKLREWFYDFPKKWLSDDLRLLRSFLEFSYLFKENSTFDKNDLFRNIRRLTDRFFNPSYWFQINFRKSNIFSLIFTHDKKGIVSFPFRYFFKAYSKLNTLLNEIIIRVPR